MSVTQLLYKDTKLLVKNSSSYDTELMFSVFIYLFNLQNKGQLEEESGTCGRTFALITEIWSLAGNACILIALILC